MSWYTPPAFGSGSNVNRNAANRNLSYNNRGNSISNLSGYPTTADAAERRANAAATTTPTPAATGVTTGKNRTATTPTAPVTNSNNTNIAAQLREQNTSNNSVKRSIAENYFRNAGFSGEAISRMMGYYNSNLNQDYDTILGIIQNSGEWKQRFAGNEQRVSSGLNPLSTDQYLAMENSYKQLLRENSDIVPSDFNQYITGWIGKDVSATELKGRLTQAREWAKSVDPNVKTLLKEYYNVDESGIAMYALAPNVTEAELTRRGNVISVAAEARGQKLDIGRNLGELLVDKGYEDATQVRSAFANVSENKETVNKLASIENTNITDEQMIKGALSIDTEAKSKLRGLKSREESRFSGSGAGTNILGTDVSGSY